MKTAYMLFDSKSQEAFNTAQLGAVLARDQEYLLPLRFDSNGADVLAYNASSCETRAIQIKARVTIHKRYCGKNLWIAFPHWIDDVQQDWYVVPHDVLVKLWGADKLKNGNGGQWSSTPPKGLLVKLIEYRVGSIVLGSGEAHILNSGIAVEQR